MRAPRRSPRRGVPGGKILVMMALLTPFVMGCLAVSADLAVLATARSQLQTVADGAALAGAMKLATERRMALPASIDPEMKSARAAAMATATANTVLGASAVLQDNPTNSAAGDVVAGYLDPAQTSSTLSTAFPILFNSVQVNAARDAGHTALVPSFFGGFFGLRGTALTVGATATAEVLTITGFKGGSENVNLLPIVLDQTTYNSMIAGNTTDQFTYTAPTSGGSGYGSVAAGGDGITESKLFPVISGNPGNWGTVNIGVSANSTSTLGDQIRYGLTPAQMATFPNSTIRLDPSASPPSITFSGDPGISAGIKDDLDSIVGKAVTIPIYDDTGSNGNNAWFRVVKFAPVRILSVDFQGTPKYVIVQPALLRDSTAITGGPTTSWREGGVIHIYLSR